MCAIAGVLYFNNANTPNKAVLKSMADAIAHRGPDDFGVFIDGSIGLASRRLAIIDKSKNGRQPMSDEQGKIWVVFNGEIYNFKELRNNLEKKGHRFVTNTDTEVIIYAYKEYGAGCVNLFRGMFAFALWDSDKKQIFLARDKVGKKPIVYYCDQKKIVFASEIKSILVHPDMKADIDYSAISHYLTFGYVPAPLTIFKQIKKLQPGNYCVVKSSGQKEIKQYWDLVFQEAKYSEHFYKSKILELLEESVKIRLNADVPIGLFLSGGIDSSAVAWAMAKNSQNKIKTFSVGFNEQKYDETKFARIIADKFSTEHTEIIVEPEVKILGEISKLYDEPFADSSAIPTYCLAKSARKKVTVVLNGDGGDENFAGYPYYKIIRASYLLDKIPYFLRKPAGSFISKLPEFKGVRTINKIFQSSFQDLPGRYCTIVGIFDSKNKGEFFKKGNFDSTEVIRSKLAHHNWDEMNKICYVDIKQNLPDDLLVKMDLATMGNSLEARSPFLDTSLLELSAKIPFSMKLRGNRLKYILVKALKNVLPADILCRKKQGFSAPINFWLKNEFKNYCYDVLDSNSFKSRRLFDHQKIISLFESNQSSKKENSRKLWSLLMLELWFREFVD